jgi:ABC-type spermidine/putrescine transport system permease subunit I
MNFKPSLLKIVISVILGLVIGYIFAWQETRSFGWMFHMNVFVVISPIFMVLIYIILSFIGKI